MKRATQSLHTPTPPSFITPPPSSPIFLSPRTSVHHKFIFILSEQLNMVLEFLPLVLVLELLPLAPLQGYLDCSGGGRGWATGHSETNRTASEAPPTSEPFLSL